MHANTRPSNIEALWREARSFGLPRQTTACHRCHTRKVKCSGGKPCRSCRQADKESECSYPERNRQVKVTQKFIQGLFDEIERLNAQINSSKTKQKGTHSSILGDYTPPLAPSNEFDDGDTSIHPKTNTKPWFDSINVFQTPVLIGEAADAAFATRFRQIISDPAGPKPTHLLRLNYASNEALMALVASDVPWPSPSRAKLLVGAALKYLNRSFHIVRRSSVFEQLDLSTRDSNWGQNPVLRFKFWTLFAIGELYSARSMVTAELPGMGYFAQGSKILGYLDERPDTDSVEVLLLLSLYSMAVNRRYSAYIFSGIAMRSAILIGLHLNCSDGQLPNPGVQEHRKRLFWTTYILDRTWASKLNHPPAIQDDDIDVDLPSDTSSLDQSSIDKTYADDFDDAAYYTASVKLSSQLTKIITSVYNLRKQNQNKNLSVRVHRALKELQSWVDDLPPHLQIDHQGRETGSPKATTLHLFFNQCVILATRPILLHALRVQVSAEPPDDGARPATIPASAMALSEACIRCARHSIHLLTHAWIDGSFVTFDCLLTQYLFSSLTILAISGLLAGEGGSQDQESFEEAIRLLEQLRDAGNCVAQEYCHHVEVIKATLSEYIRRKLPPLNTDTTGDANPTEQVPVFDGNMGYTAPSAVAPSALLMETSLQQLLSQPMLDLQFLDDLVQEDYAQGLYWPEINDPT